MGSWWGVLGDEGETVSHPSAYWTNWKCNSEFLRMFCESAVSSFTACQHSTLSPLFCLPSFPLLSSGHHFSKNKRSLIIDIPQPPINLCSTFSLSTYNFLHIFIRIFVPKITTHYWYWSARKNCLLTKKTDFFFVRKTTKNYN